MSSSLYGPLYGSNYLATVMTTALYGVACMQTFFYYIHYPNDPSWIKNTVAVSWVLNTIHEGFIISGTYIYTISGMTDPSSVQSANSLLVVIFTTLVAIITQGFLIRRIYILNGKKNFWVLLCLILGIFQLVSTLIFIQKSLPSANGLQSLPANLLDQEAFTTLGICLAVGAGEDALIAIFMTFLLYRERTATNFASTAHILQRLTFFSVNTGIWPVVFALLTVILLHLFPTKFFFAVTGIPLCSVYYNTLLANLNARMYFETEATTHDVSVELFTSSSSQPKSIKIISHYMDVSWYRPTPRSERGEQAELTFSPPEGVCNYRRDANWSMTLEDV